MNEEIELLLSTFTVDEQPIAFEYMQYIAKNGEPYIVYYQYDKDNSYSANDDIEGYVVYYDFDIYSKGNYLKIADELRKLLKANEWTYQPRRESPDLYEPDTGYFHKTLCFARPIQITD